MSVQAYSSCCALLELPEIVYPFIWQCPSIDGHWLRGLCQRHGSASRTSGSKGFAACTFHGVSDFAEPFRPKRRIYVQGHRRRGMTKLFLQGLYIRAVRDRYRRVGMTQRMRGGMPLSSMPAFRTARLKTRLRHVRTYNGPPCSPRNT